MEEAPGVQGVGVEAEQAVRGAPGEAEAKVGTVAEEDQAVAADRAQAEAEAAAGEEEAGAEEEAEGQSPRWCREEWGSE